MSISTVLTAFQCHGTKILKNTILIKIYNKSSNCQRKKVWIFWLYFHNIQTLSYQRCLYCNVALTRGHSTESLTSCDLTLIWPDQSNRQSRSQCVTCLCEPGRLFIVLVSKSVSNTRTNWQRQRGQKERVRVEENKKKKEQTKDKVEKQKKRQKEIKKIIVDGRRKQNDWWWRRKKKKKLI